MKKIQVKTQSKAGKTTAKNPNKPQKTAKPSPVGGVKSASAKPKPKVKKPLQEVKKSAANKQVGPKPRAKKVPVQKKPAPKPNQTVNLVTKPVAKSLSSEKKPVQAVKASYAPSRPESEQENNNKIVEKVENKVEKKPRIAAPTTIGPLNLPPFKQEKGEEYMSKRQLDYFLEILNTWRDQLHAERNATVQHMQEDPINFPDLLDRAALEEEHKLEWQTREREHKLIIKIEKAVARIKQGDYGFCEKCGSEIGLLRLQVRPTATLCVDCKAIDEIREKQTGLID